MKRFAAFLRGVSPMNCRMAELAAAMEAAGFTGVKTVLSSGNVVFGATGTSRSVARKAEAAMQEHMGRRFLTIVRPVAQLQAMLEADPYRSFRIPAGAKRVVTFLAAEPAEPPTLPLRSEGATMLLRDGLELYSAYVPGPKAAAFMGVIERAFGKDVTTRT
ncbi:MAG TPA: DUF1697 domain-containing protein, partial [Ramlibacter sp.]|nr:DUF1697 domain-containing protein [Ramlibacter sp.]